MPALIKFHDYVEQLSRGVHLWHTHTFKLALSNTAPAQTNTVLADITQISSGGGYTSGAGGGYTLDSISLSETTGTATLSLADEVITASGGSVGPFRYLIVYNDTATSPADALVGYYDYGSSITLLTGESLTVDWPGNLWTLA